jgi:hypothetical protein
MFLLWQSAKHKPGFSLSKFFSNYYGHSKDLLTPTNSMYVHEFVHKSPLVPLRLAKIDPAHPEKIIIDPKNIITWREGSTTTSYDEYTRKISTFAKVFYLKDAANSFKIKSVLAKGSPEYSDYHETEWLAYAKYAFDRFLNELKSYNK